MTETAAQRELAKQARRLEREAKHQVDVAVVRCDQHGPHYACPDSKPTEGHEWAWRDINTDGDITGDLGRVRVPNGVMTAHCGHIACKHIVNQRCPECPPQEP